MAITVDQRLAICRIYVPGTKARGTGFLIKDGGGKLFVLTAAHVVNKSMKESDQKYAGKDIQLHFGADRTLIRHAWVGSFKQDVDAATLCLPAGAQLPPGVKPYSLRPCARGYQVVWETFGYSDESEKRGPQGQAYGGTIRTSDPNHSQLKVDQIHGSPAGLSGGPVIVDGQVVGIILKTADKESSETVFARCVSCLVGKELPEIVLEKIPVAWVDEATFLLRQFDDLLIKTAVALKLGSNRDDVLNTIPRENRPARVAEAMLMSADAALTGIENLKLGFQDRQGPGDPTPPEKASWIVDWSLKTWIDQKAVRMLADSLRRGDQVIVLNAKAENPSGRWDLVAQWYVHRAGCLDSNHPGIFQNVFALDLETVDDAYMLTMLRKALAQTLAPEGTEPSEDDEPPEDNEPVIVLLTNLPRRSSLDSVRASIREEHPEVRFILVTGGEIPSFIVEEFPAACIIDPRLVEDQVKQALAADKSAQKKLKDIFKPKRANGKS